MMKGLVKRRVRTWVEALRARTFEVLSRRRPGEALGEVLALLCQELSLDLALLAVRPSGARAFRPFLQWAREEGLEKSLQALLDPGKGKPLEEVVRGGRGLYAADLRQKRWAAVRGDLGSLYLLPLVWREDLSILLLLGGKARNALPPSRRRLLEGLAPTLAAGAEAWWYERELADLNRALEERVQHRTFELQILHDLSAQIGYALTYSELFSLIHRSLHRAVLHDLSASLLEVEEHYRVYYHTERPLSPSLRERVCQLLVEAFAQLRGIPEAAVRERVQEVNQPPAATEASGPPLRHLASLLTVPFFTQSAVVGVLLVASEQEKAFHDTQVRLLYGLSHYGSLAVQRVRALLAVEQARLQALVEGLPLGAVLLDAGGKVLTANSLGERYLGLLASWEGGRLMGLGGRPLEELGGRTGHRPLDLSVGNRTFEVLVRSLPGPEPEGFSLVLLRDVTEERQAQSQLLSQNRLAAIGELAAGIAHDFNNILTVILGFAELLVNDPSLPPPLRERMEIIHRHAQRGSRLVRQILDFSRASISQRAPMDLLPFLEETLGFFRQTLPSTIQISLEAQPGEYTVEGDAVQLQQVLTNLVVNARDAMPHGGEVRVRLERVSVPPGEGRPFPFGTGAGLPPGEWVAISVADTGTGIPPEVLPRIFEPFFTTKGPKGSGLGLAQVYGIIEQHRGYVEVKTEVGRGSTFTIYLPAWEGKGAPQKGETGPEEYIPAVN